MSDQQPYELPDEVSGLDRPDVDVPGADAVAESDTSSILEDDDQTVVPPALSNRGSRGGFGRRLLGLIATVLGLAGCLLSLAVAVVMLRFGLAAGDAADGLIEPISSSVDQLETRVDQTDDLVGRSGVDAGDLDLLSARADGLADLSDGVQRSFSAISDHPIYRWLPVELDSLQSVLGDIEESSSSIASAARSGADNGRIPANDANRISEEVNQLQAGFGNVRGVVEEAKDSLTSWIRLATLAGVALALWSLWAQSWLLRRGWRAILGHAP